METTYRGVVKDGVVVLLDGGDLVDGTAVEVRVVQRSGERPQRLTPGSPLAQRLIASGLMREVKPPIAVAPEADRTPIEVRGEPLSESIIRDRR